jgi:hypothetical protein
VKKSNKMRELSKNRPFEQPKTILSEPIVLEDKNIETQEKTEKKTESIISFIKKKIVRKKS